MQTYSIVYQRFKTQNENQEIIFVQEMNLCCYFYFSAMLIFVSISALQSLYRSVYCRGFCCFFLSSYILKVIMNNYL